MVQYEVDQQHTHIGFTAKHLGVSTVRGRFNKFEGQFQGPDEDFTKARGEVRIEVASLESRSDQRDTHLRSADFFDVEKYPYITFKLTKVEAVDAESVRITGDLTVKDVTRPIVLDGTIEGRMADPFGAKERVGISARGQLDRMDFGLNWNGVAGAVPFASHTVKLEVDAEIVVKVAQLAQAS
jgi:polyisoprenoid-binding protein YceI